MTKSSSPAPTPEILTAKEAADLLGLHVTTLYESAKRGEIPCRRAGRRFLFERHTLVGWLRSPATISEQPTP